MVDDFFNTEEELEPVKEDIKILVEELAQKLYKGGKITSKNLEKSECMG